MYYLAKYRFLFGGLIMEYFELINKRHSVRSYMADIIEEEKLNKILDAARLAPTAANRQPFKIIVIHTEGHAEELKSIYGRDWFVQAPVIICVCSIPGKAWVRSDSKNYSDVDAAIVMDHIVLAATALGLGTCWIGAFNIEAAKKVLGLEDGLEPVAFTPVGYPGSSEFKKVRKELSELVIYR
jgi:nitroreductase